MDITIKAALIGAGATILAAIIGKMPLEMLLSWLFRWQQGITKIQIMKTIWKANWYYEDGTLYASDKVIFKKWTKRNQFKGEGDLLLNDEGVTKTYTYPITGEVAQSRLVVLTYKAERYPTEGNIGMACLELSNSAEKLDGYWAGRASKKLEDGREVHMVRGGVVKMQKIKDLN